ncbi:MULTISPECIES: ABC-F family ATP-binding cassette domain-containing protein [unclassified Sedimentibacter]|uniref:ABC-F family ATP-binding cassette domain-containing protein n=1 Tax=unclassified Sedimentibacter TaxID=2649220 RepID=UPI0027E17E36|nr:ABC-F family ATP-binding cassette domain-containing protein [Sedimentibacter sp. MB35-C1]WMJ78419.1 ABC-F family ATP-binding cassette domain-containing protein [Sedimentibacter sp. MB35-C1]
MILTLENISKSFGLKPLLDNVNLYIESNDKIGFVGINGTGKSTLLKIAAQIEEPDSGNIVYRNGVRVGYLPQVPEFSDNLTVLEQIFLNASSETKVLMEYEAKTILNKLGIDEFDKNVSLLSVGQRKKVAIASALVNPCELLILDEPTNHLDNEMIAWLENYLIKYSGAILMVTHDRYFLNRVSNRIVELHRGNLYAYEGNYSKFLELKTLREESEQSSERKKRTLYKKELAWIQRGARARGTKAKGRIQEFEKLKEQMGTEIDDKLEVGSVSSRLGKKTIEIKNISKSYGGKKIIDNFEYIVLRDARLGIVGANGSGKSTLMNIIAGKISSDSGNVEIGSTVKLGYFAQEADNIDVSERVIDYIKNIAEIVETNDGKITASQMLEKFLFSSDLQYNTIDRLSGGERRRLFLLGVLMKSPNILLLDEPTNDLDIETLTILEDYLESFKGAVITVSHDRYFLDKVVNTILELPGDGIGEIKEYNGGYSDYISEKSANERKNVDEKQKKEKSVTKEIREKPKKLKFTYRELREYETIDDDIAQLENNISHLENQLEKYSTDYVKLQELMDEKHFQEKKLEEKMNRWVYLNDLAEKIENSKN